MALYFDQSALPNPSIEYVAWVDVMGIQAAMSRSLSISSNFMCKLHAAALEHLEEGVTLYPVMDGFYVTSSTKRTIQNFLRSVLGVVADEFINEQKNHHRFVVKGALAYGPVVHGHQIPPTASRSIANNQEYAKTLLLGVPMVQANRSERLAPAFGIYIHESARSFSPAGERPFGVQWWSWETTPSLRKRHLKYSLIDYYHWCSERASALGYELDRINAHRLMMEHYFADVL